MKNQDFKIRIKTVWILVIGNILLIAAGALARIQNWSGSDFLLTTGLIFYFSSWVIILSDMLRNKIYNKTFWIVTMFTVPGISSVFYLIQRNRLIRMGKRFS